MYVYRLAVAVVLASSSVALAGIGGPPPGVIVNPISDTEIVVDGLFTGGVSGGTLLGGTEWWDITPQGYISPVQGSGFSELVRTPPGTPNALTYAAIAPTQVGGAADDFYLMYAYEPRQDTFL